MNVKLISVVIPCLNEENTIERAVQDAFCGLAKGSFDGEVLVADNNSSDFSADIARKAGARVELILERGYGSAVMGGLLAAKNNIIVIADADLSYDLRDLKSLVAPIFNEKADLVIGNRYAGTMQKGAMPCLNKYLGTPAISLLMRKLHRVHISDCNSGYRAFKISKDEIRQFRATGMEFASEMLICFSKIGKKITEVPINYYKDQRGHASHLNRWRDGLRHLKLIFQEKFYKF